MKKVLISIASLLLILSFLLSSCSSSLAPVTTAENKTEEAPAKTEEKKDDSTDKTEEKEEKETKPNKIMQKEDPTKDDTLNILMIGNSFCTFYPDELYGLATAAGMKVRVCSVYYSGCSTQQHWEWLLDNHNPYKLYTVEDNNGRKAISSMTLNKCLQQQNWDVISLQQHFSPARAASYESAMNATASTAKKLFDYLKVQFPQSKLYWHETWAYEKGFIKDTGSIETEAQQTNQYQVIQKASTDIAKENGVPMIPCGDAWQIARANPTIGDTLCIGTEKGNGAGDHYHDGNTGGGQYLNACVWFETLTGKSCIGNSFRPKYDLAEEKLPILQEAAHKAVADLYGANFAK